MIDVFLYGPLIDNPIHPKRKRMYRLLDEIYDYHESMIKQKLEDYISQHERDDSAIEHNATDFIPYLYFERKLSLIDIKSNVMSLLLAAVETVSTRLSFVAIVFSEL